MLEKKSKLSLSQWNNCVHMIIGKSDAADTQMHSKHRINNECEIKIQSVLHSSSDPLVSFCVSPFPPRLL